VVDAKALSEGRFADDEEAVQKQREADPNLDHDNPIEELFEDQLNCADIVIFNKTDLLANGEAQRLAKTLNAQIRAGTRLVPASNGAIDISALLGLSASVEADIANRPSRHELEGEEPDHDDFESFVVSLGKIASKEALLNRIKKLISEHDVLRLKGFAALQESSSRLLIQAVGPRLNTYFDRPWKTNESCRTEIVVIGRKGLDRDSIERTLRE